ncbi:MAG: Lrp/AsnC ligand binding domain-containing protein [Candidatus Humimicrobiaceae bacterium]
MMKAYILINVEVEKVEDAFEKIKKIKEIKEAHTIIGPYDIITLVEENDLEQISNINLKKIQNVEGVIKTLTCLIVK